jgi:hypothetical protein
VAALIGVLASYGENVLNTTTRRHDDADGEDQTEHDGMDEIMVRERRSR